MRNWEWKLISMSLIKVSSSGDMTVCISLRLEEFLYHAMLFWLQITELNQLKRFEQHSHQKSLNNFPTYLIFCSFQTATSFFLTAPWSSLHRKKYRQATSGLSYLKSHLRMTKNEFFFFNYEVASLDLKLNVGCQVWDQSSEMIVRSIAIQYPLFLCRGGCLRHDVILTNLKISFIFLTHYN